MAINEIEEPNCFEELHTQNDGISCNGEFTLSECVEMAQAIPYLGVVQGEKLSSVLWKIAKALKDANTRIDHRLNYTSLQVFSDNQSAVNGGLIVGDIYKTPTGYLMVVI